MASDDVQNTGAFEENATLPKVEVPLDSTAQVEQQHVSKPVEGSAPGIDSVADFIPKDAPTSHPTPPPDEPLATSEANVDVEMTGADVLPKEEEPATAAAPPTESVPAPAPATSLPEPSLVRPREDDEEDDEPAAKRSKVEGDSSSQEGISAEMSAVALTNGTHSESTQQQSDVADASASAPPAQEPKLEESKSDAVASVERAPDASAALPESAGSLPVQNGDPPAATSTTETTNGASAIQSAPVDAKPAVDAAQTSTQPPASAPISASAPAPAPASSTATSTPTYSTAPMTQLQKNFLQEKMKNLKKTKNSAAFLNPVDHQALNIPSYPEIIKNPMDLNTMEQKLKTGKYDNVQAFADDFNLILFNTRTFNGPAHAVTQAGSAMDAYFRKMMESVPSPSLAAPVKTQPTKKASPKPAAPPRREARAPAPPAAGAAAPFALQSDGVPQIRRESTANRPARAIKPPPAKELTYAKPKRKEHQLELKFCDHVLNQIRSARYANCNSVFLAPVDPVALNIPHYRQVVKHPMDLGTMTQKLKQGQYAKASEVKRDFDLMIQNCLAFNPTGNVVRDMGIALQREFEGLWRTKEKWEKSMRSTQNGNSSADDDESGEDDDEEEEEESVPDASAQTIAALQKQLMDMQNALAGLNKAPKQKKVKPAKTSHKKGGGAAAPKSKAAAPKSKPKKTKIVSYEEKQEISEAVGNMSGPQVEELTRIITTNCKKYAEQEEMELEIDDLPNDVQYMLLQYVRSIFGNPNGRNRVATPDELVDEDDEFEPERTNKRGGGGGGGNGAAKRKKHKPMGKEEQQMAIDNIQKQLAQFSGGGGAMPAANGYTGAGEGAGETSGDDESEESEEE